jgi:hypothetical protein
VKNVQTNVMVSRMAGSHATTRGDITMPCDRVYPPGKLVVGGEVAVAGTTGTRPGGGAGRSAGFSIDMDGGSGGRMIELAGVGDAGGMVGTKLAGGFGETESDNTVGMYRVGASKA